MMLSELELASACPGPRVCRAVPAVLAVALLEASPVALSSECTLALACLHTDEGQGVPVLTQWSPGV